MNMKLDNDVGRHFFMYSGSVTYECFTQVTEDTK